MKHLISWVHLFVSLMIHSMCDDILMNIVRYVARDLHESLRVLFHVLARSFLSMKSTTNTTDNILNDLV
jgi:hypothetical protein